MSSPRAVIAHVYVGCVVAAAAAAVYAVLPHMQFDRPMLLAAIVVVGCAAARLRLEVPFAAFGGTLPVAYGGTLAALMLLDMRAAVFVAIVSTILQSLTSRPRPSAYLSLFGIAVVVLAVASAGEVNTWLGGKPGLDLAALSGPLMAAVTSYLFVHVALVSPAIALTSRERFDAVVQETLLSAAPSYFAGALITAVFVSGHSPWLMALACGPLYLLLHMHRVHEERHEEHEQHVEQLGALHVATTQALARAIDAKDQFGQGHIRRVQVYARGLASALNMSATEVKGVETAAMLHDVGKIGVPDYILSKPGPLTRDEFRRVRRHPEIGADIIADVPFPYPVAPYIRSHHERWDGTGYPDGLIGEKIPLGARILSVVDYYDALVSDWPYHRAMTEDDAMAILVSESGKALDPTIVSTFVALRPALQMSLEPEVPPARIQVLGPDPGGPARPATGFAPALDSVFRDIASVHREVGALYEMAQGLGACFSIDGTMDMIESKLHQLVPLSACALFIIDKDGETVRCRAARGVNADLLCRLTLRNSAGVNGWVARHRRPVTNAKARWDLQMLTGDLSAVSLRSAAAFPLVVNDRVIGTLALYHVEDDYYTDERCLPLDRACEQIAAVVNNALVFEQTQAESLTDPLTNLPNARQLRAFMSDELSRAERQNMPVALIIMDVDEFKHINDQYGHDAGNRALCAVARAMRDAVRVADLCARYAGDEFVVALSGCDEATADEKRVQISRAIADLTFMARPGLAGRITVSSGLAVFPADASDYEGLLAVADQRMYLEKAERRALASGDVGAPRAAPLPHLVSREPKRSAAV